jgi:hypothetical protein
MLLNLFLSPLLKLLRKKSLTLPSPVEDDSTGWIGADPAAFESFGGTGSLGKLLHLNDDSGICAGGIWIANGSLAFTQTQTDRQVTGNNLFVLNLTADTGEM